MRHFHTLNAGFIGLKKNGNKNEMYQELGFEYENYRDLGEYDKAFEAFEKIQQLDIAFNGKKDALTEFYTLAELQRRLGNYPVALNYYHKLVANKDLQHEGIWLRISYPELFALNDKFDSARYYYNLIDSSKLNSNDLAFYLASLGEFYLWQKKYDSAITPLLRGLEYYRKVHDINYQKRSLIDIAKTYAGLQKDNEALAYVHEALDLSIRSHAKQYMRDCYEILYEICQRRNEPDSAFVYYQKYVTQKEIVANDVVKGKFAAYNYEQQIALLDNEKIVQKQKLQREKTDRNILIATLIIGLLLAAFFIRNTQLKRKKDQLQHLMTEANTQLDNRRKEQQLVEMQQQKTELEMQALRAQMNPHFIFNSLNSINMFILENNKLQASEYLSKFSRLVRLILQNSQEAFIPLERELEALKLYLELESLRFENKFEYKISVDGSVDTTVLKVPPLVIQPYAENAIWHGLMQKREKGHLEIELYAENQILFYKITDDGIGRKKATDLKSKSGLTQKSMGMRHYRRPNCDDRTAK
jgi:tetratricopeptide (TPR) repeat protein